MATGDAKIILRSDNKRAILDLKRQAAAECRVRHGMTVINDDTTEYESQDNGLAEMAVREVKGVARSVRVALSELYKKDISSKHPVLPWLVSYTAGQITRGQIGADGLTPHQRLKGRAFRKLLLVFAESVLYLLLAREQVVSRNVGAMDCSSGSLRGARNSTLALCLVSCELEV